jgi:hypothetical protein
MGQNRGRQWAEASLELLTQQFPLPFELSFQLSSLHATLFNVIQRTHLHRLHSSIWMVAHHVLKLLPLLLVDRQVGTHALAEQTLAIHVFRAMHESLQGLTSQFYSPLLADAHQGRQGDAQPVVLADYRGRFER